ncbi:MAG: hypothetical protein JSS49_28075 [Planctomycetes bacterium]|nr:hypothetical protein [Planctomycetota bacterium]
MTELTRLEQAVTLLSAAYGSLGLAQGESTWARFVRVLMGIPTGHAASDTLVGLLQTGPLAAPGESSVATPGQLVEILAPIPRGSQKASVIRAVAAWWLAQFGDEVSPAWSVSPQSYRESLRQIRGLGPATVDELLLFAADLPVFPVDRTALRVAVRHGWLDLPVEDEDAQSLFVRGVDGSPARLQELARLLTRVGESHCGREPNCEGCPLQSLLPSGGPLNPQSC